MKAEAKVLSAVGLLKSIFFNKRMPLIVSWALTNRCNRKCKYCNSWKEESDEMNTDQIFSTINELSKMGTKIIQFTGGEPLLRKDLGDILNYCKRKKISVNVNYSGTLVPKRIIELRSLDTLSLSLDGPREVQDSIRGRGSYQEVMEAIESAKTNRIKFRFFTVLSKLNLDCVDFMLSRANELKTSVIFQPATSLILFGNDKNPIAPPEKEYKQVINKLISEKRKNRNIGNSIPGLKHLYYWPNPKSIKCLGKYIFCRIESNGDVKICPRAENNHINCVELGFENAFDNIVLKGCSYCWCGSAVEVSFSISLNLSSLLNSVKFI